MKKSYPLITLIIISLSIFIPGSSSAAITGECGNCHTMHNSQGGAPMNFNDSATPNELLLRGDCIGCHAMNGTSKIETIGGSEIPQVFHRDSQDLAGGNFAYISGVNGSGASDAKGHNVIDLLNNDATLFDPPGAVHGSQVNNDEFTCAGNNGCHGTRIVSGESGVGALRGAHHQNVDGRCNVSDSVSNSYRFLKGVMGFENTGIDKYENKDENSHNEYYGTTTPWEDDVCSSCHGGSPSEILPDNNTISALCATCHGHFHRLSGIGGDTASPFTRHPTDIVLSAGGEYAAYTTYSVEAPIARPTVAGGISSTVTPGTDIVMCLSCHAAHASDYPDMLRWDYNDMDAGGGGSGGCFTCHTLKDN